MAAYGIDELIALIISTVYQNSSGDVSGQDLQDRLEDMMDSLNQSLYDNTVPYNVGQSVTFNDGGTYKHYSCTTATVAGESPTGAPSKWTLTSAVGISLDSIELDITALKAVTGYSNDDQILVNSNNGLYVFDDTSITPGDDDLVVTPDDITEPAPGRWLKIKTLVDTTMTGDIANLISPITTNLVAAINGLAVDGVEIVNNITALKAIPSARRYVKAIIVRYYDEGDEGAVSGGVNRILFYKGPDFTNPEWEDLANYQQIEPIVTENFTTTETIGGIPALTAYTVGDTLESIIKALLTRYIPSSITSFTVQNTPSGNEFEVGATIEVDSVTSAVGNDSAGDPPLTLNVAGEGYNTGVIPGVVPPAATTNVQKTTDESEVYTITGTDANSDPINSIQVSLDWLFKHFFGSNSTLLTGGSTDGEVTTVIDALQISSLETDQSKIVTTTADNANQSNYTYIAYAAKYGDLTNIIQNGGINVLGAFTEIGDFNYTNSEGHIESYKVYKSNALGAFATGVELNIS